jgi:ribonuclease R
MYSQPKGSVNSVQGHCSEAMATRKKRNDWRAKDPFHAREARLYEHPIPSREYLMQYLSERGRPATREHVCGELLLDESACGALERRLDAMVRNGQLVRNRRGGYGPVDKLDLIRGRVVGHPDGYGFLVPDEGGEHLYLSPRVMRELIHGDRALVRVSGVDRRGRKEASLVEVLERNTNQLVGRYFMEAGIGIVAPDNARVRHDVLIPPNLRGDARDGQIVVVELAEQPSKRSQPMGKVVEVLGDHMAPGMEIDIAIRSHGLPFEWPPALREEIADLSTLVPESAKAGRTDLRHLSLVTIDGPDAKDFDDAVYCERNPRGWKLLVAIADVSAYVASGTVLDEEAYSRGTSVYFPGRVIPMLPEILSNGLCSLNPDVDRLCMVCELYINDQGETTRARFFEAVMRSHARLIYDEVAAILVEGDQKLRDRYQALLPQLEALYGVYQVLRAAREKRGAIDFDTEETRIVFGLGKKIERIEPLERNDAHRLIEECMVAANVAAARFLERHRIPALYRVHQPPTQDKLADLRQFLAEVGLRLKGGQSPEPQHYAELLGRLAGRTDSHLVQTVMLRSLAQAVYSPDNVGHFGLAHHAYAHFTSPIRRYPDLLVHRAIRHVLRKGKSSDFIYTPADMLTFGEHCSSTERRADEATRDAVEWLKCEYVLDKVGEVFDGVITAVTSFGLFVELDRVYVEGLVHVTALRSDYYHFEPLHHRLEGERTGRVYRLGDPLRVRVVRVDLDERKIDFEPVDEAPAARRHGTRRRR